MTRLRIYADTSVFGGCFDNEFNDPTARFFDAVLRGRATLLISDTLVAELTEAPGEVQTLLERVIRAGCERLELTREAIDLREAYLRTAVVPPRYANDALHVAQATLARADIILSWNFRHLVNPTSIRAFNGVNLAQGYGLVVIMTPTDIVSVLEHQDED